MATFIKRTSRRRGVRHTARVRLQGREVTKTFPTLTAAKSWARSQERAIETHEFVAPVPGTGPIFADAVDSLIEHRKLIGRPPGHSFGAICERLKREHGLEPLANLDAQFWRKHGIDRLAKGLSGAAVQSDLTYAGVVLRHAKREGHAVDALAPATARALLREDGVQLKAKERTRRLSDAELKKLFAWIEKNRERTVFPLRDIVEFALATGMRRGEIFALEWDQLAGRVATFRRKHPREKDRIERVPLLKKNKAWPRVDPLEIIKRQPKRSRRVFPYVADSVAFMFEKACEGAGLDGVVFHVLRHECLSRLADRGFDPLRLAMVGGHRDLKSVKRYAKLDAARLANE